MDQTVIIAVGIIAALLALIALMFVLQRRKTAELKKSYGDEYDRTLKQSTGRSRAEADLVERQRRVEKYEIRPVTPSEHDQFVAQWHDARNEFVDQPIAALDMADDIVTDVLRTRGYPVGDFEKAHKDMTVKHGATARDYLEAHTVRERALKDDAGTEEMRRAMKRYEALFDELITDIETDAPAHTAG